LVADDDDVREITALSLRDSGYDVTEACTGSAPLGVLDADPAIDLLIADFAMPECRERNCSNECVLSTRTSAWFSSPVLARSFMRNSVAQSQGQAANIN
jgi:CheY-like chemotaxis protein